MLQKLFNWLLYTLIFNGRPRSFFDDNFDNNPFLRRASINLHRVNIYGVRFSFIPIASALALMLTADSLPQAAYIGAFCLLIWAAAFTIGGGLGFLFGIPRGIEGARENGSKGGSPLAPMAAGVAGSAINTNLVQISDWLTKILVGAALTQLKPILKLFHDVIVELTAVAPGTADMPLGIGVIGGLLVYGLVFGFVWGHLWTTLFLVLAYVAVQNAASGVLPASSTQTGQIVSNVVNQADLNPQPDKNTRAFVQNIEFDAGTKELAQETAKVGINKLVTYQDFLDWARAKLAVGGVDEAVAAYRQAIAMRPDVAEPRLELAKVLSANKRRREAAREFSHVLSLPKNSVSLATRQRTQFNIALNSLYDDPPKGFESALKILGELAQTNAFETDAHYWVVVACAHGQAYRHRLATTQADPKTDPILGEHRKMALKAIRRVKELDDEWLPFLRKCWRPKPGGRDNDLDAFANDGEFTEELEVKI